MWQKEILDAQDLNLETTSSMIMHPPKCEHEHLHARKTPEEIAEDIRKSIIKNYPDFKNIEVEIYLSESNNSKSVIYVHGEDYNVADQNSFFGFMEDLVMKYELELLESQNGFYVDDDNKGAMADIKFSPVNWPAFEMFCPDDDVQCTWCFWHGKMKRTYRGFCPICRSTWISIP